MRIRLAVAALAAVAPAALPAPSSAAVLLPYCTATLTAAASGATTACSVETAKTLQGDPYRQLTLTVTQGRAYATLTCEYASTSLTLTGPSSKSDAIPDAGGVCTVRITALTANTTANATTLPGRRPPDAL